MRLRPRKCSTRLTRASLISRRAAESYSKDTASAAEGGNVGWDRLSNLVTEYTTALADLNKGDVSGW